MYPQFSDKEISVLKQMMSQYYENQCSFGTSSSTPAWGTISGSIGDQTDLSAALSSKIPLTGSSSLSGSFLPSTPNVSDLGDGTYRFRGGYFQNVYASGKMFVGALTSSAYTGLTVDVGLTSFLGGTTTLNGALLPNVSGLNLGGASAGQHWGVVYANNVGAITSTLALSGGNSRVVLEHSAVGSTPKIQIGYNSLTTGANLAKVGYATLNSPNSNQYAWDVAPNVNQSGTASYTVSRISPRIVASVGSNNRLFSAGTNDADYGTGNHTEVFGIEPSGDTYTAGNALFGTTTKAGYRVDVNGTARIQGDLTASANLGVGVTASSRLTVKASNASSTGGFRVLSSTNSDVILSFQDSFSGNRGLLTLRSANVDRISLDAGGISSFANDVEITDNTKGLILRTPDGRRYRITIGNDAMLALTLL